MQQFIIAITRAYPELEIKEAILTDWSGQNNDVLLVNGELVFRFPKYQFGVDLIENEVGVLGWIRPKITLPIPNPHYRHASTVGNSFIAYPLLPGKSLSHERLNVLDDPTQQHIADQLANYLRELHALPVDFEMVNVEQMKKVLHNLFDIPIAALDFEVPTNNGPLVIRGMYDSFRRYLYPHMCENARTAMTVHFEHYFNTPALHQFEPTWCHGDFGGENILFDGENVSGIIDFSFTGIGDPAIDIAAISTYGDRFFSKLLASYPAANAMLGRAKFYRGIFALEEALHGILHNDPAAFEAGIADYR